MRIWHTDLLPYLPDLQLNGQWRELVSIMRDLKNKGKTNHLLINRVCEYEDAGLRLASYASIYFRCRARRYGSCSLNGFEEFYELDKRFYDCIYKNPYIDWHNDEYLRVCMANLYEKHKFGIGKSRITDDEWERLCEGYKKITGEEYKI